jgi:UDP-N-acetylmuramate: L-alanyl-gamma-D-glutamyl-meso-diaminopimelate ligase|tara:strand:- start:468 stop:1829 length:1362 start_codon:yes stop_codon:yes gene_type:complete
MHIHILGICGTFMTGIASMAQSLGHQVTGSDQNFYPPMSDALRHLNIEVDENYDPLQLDRRPDCCIVGNVMTRGHPVIEFMLDKKIPFKSGPQWLSENILNDRFVIAVSGTHGKTTTTSMLSWILEDNGYSPGYLIGGVPNNFNSSARIGNSKYFVIEADEYDTAFFDKRPKFIHYQPTITIMNNLEFDHADIYKNIDEIKWQFHQLVRITPQSGKIIFNGSDENIHDVIKLGNWTPTETFGLKGNHDWLAKKMAKNSISIKHKNTISASSSWNMSGSYNIENALAAIAAANSIGITPASSLESLASYKGVKRRLEKLVTISNITIYDDFAHHPTSIKKTIEGIHENHSHKRIIIAIEIRSNTMLSGAHNSALLESVKDADFVFFYQSNKDKRSLESQGLLDKNNMQITYDIEVLAAKLISILRDDDALIFMSNGDFCGAKELFTKQLEKLHV